MNHVGMLRCPSCDRRAPKGSSYCSRCGAALQGVARRLGVVPAIVTGGFVVASTTLVQIVLSRAMETSGRVIPVLAGYFELMGHLVDNADLLFAGVGGMMCGAMLKGRPFWVRAALAACVGGFLFSSRLVAGLAGSDLIGVVDVGIGVVLATIGGLLGPGLIPWAAGLAPFSWAKRLSQDSGSLWCFAVLVMGLQVVFLVVPWLVLWVFAGSAALRLARKLVAGGRTAGRDQALGQVAS